MDIASHARSRVSAVPAATTMTMAAKVRLRSARLAACRGYPPSRAVYAALYTKMPIPTSPIRRRNKPPSDDERSSNAPMGVLAGSLAVTLAPVSHTPAADASTAHPTAPAAAET